MTSARAYMAPMKYSESLLFTAYRSSLNHFHTLNPRNRAVITPDTVMSGIPATVYLAIGEFWYRVFFRHGRIAAAIAVPRNVTAMTRVASRMYVAKLLVYAYRAPTPIEGTSISTRAHTGTCRRSDTSATRSGRIRSNAAAKITRVDDRKSVPAHPRNQAPNISTMIACTIVLWK